MEILCFRCKGNWDLTHGGDGSKCLGRGNHQQRSEKLGLERFPCRLSLSLLVACGSGRAVGVSGTMLSSRALGGQE